ncbi:MAG: hypothetical protein RR418_03925 [Clostridia bacterium]
MKTGRILILVMSLILTVALAGTTTFAWFTMNDTVGVNGLNFNVDGNEGLMISANNADGSYRMNLKSGDTALGMPGTADISLTAVTPKLSTTAWDATYAFEDKAGTQTGTVATPGATGGFYVLHLWLKSDLAMTVTLDKLTIGAVAGTGKNVQNPFQDKFDADGTGNGAYAPTAGKTLDVSYYGGTGEDIATGGAITAEAQNATRFAVFTVNATTYAFKAAYDPNSTLGWTDNTANLAADLYDIISNQALGTTTHVEMTGIKTVPDADVICTLTAGVAQEIAVVVWIEGKDGDCFNGIIGDKLVVSFSFKGTKVV